MRISNNQMFQYVSTPPRDYCINKENYDCDFISIVVSIIDGCSGVVVEYRTRNREVAGSTYTRSTASNLEQVANLLCAQANSASYPQRDGK